MDQTAEIELLERYAQAANHPVYSTQSDLDPSDSPMPEMHAWCKQQGNIVVMQSGLILTCKPVSRTVQNCKSILISKGLIPGKVVPATSALIDMLLANFSDQDSEAFYNNKIYSGVSGQQQRLRILVKEALMASASDIHIEVREEMAHVRFRKHGELYLHAEWVARLGRELAAVAFNKETDHATAHFNPMIPQSASMPLAIDGANIRLRLASLPAHGGFDVVMRVLTVGEDEVPDLFALGYTAEQVMIIDKAIHRPQGAVLFSGPTGSGKTTTLASCLKRIEFSRKVYTIEDPVEKLVNNTTQIPVNTEQSDRNFASMGRAALRMDPDVMVLGETRDQDTAAVLVRAAIAGHLVLSTVHTHNAPNIITRLADLGVSPVILGDPQLLVCLVSQRLVPTLCQDCATPILESELHQPELPRWEAIFGEQLSAIKVRGQEACEHCHGSGVLGRTVIAEVIWVDEAGREFVQQRDTFGWEQYLKNQGWRSMAEHARSKLLQGLIDPLDAERIIGEMDSRFSLPRFRYHSEDYRV